VYSLSSSGTFLGYILAATASRLLLKFSPHYESIRDNSFLSDCGILGVRDNQG
jgi:hypothetical protein